MPIQRWQAYDVDDLGRIPDCDFQGHVLHSHKMEDLEVEHVWESGGPKTQVYSGTIERTECMGLVARCEGFGVQLDNEGNVTGKLLKMSGWSEKKCFNCEECPTFVVPEPPMTGSLLVGLLILLVFWRRKRNRHGNHQLRMG